MKIRTFLLSLLSFIPLSCGEGSGSSSSEASSSSGISSSGAGGIAACTPEGQGFKDSTPLMVTPVDLFGNGSDGPCFQSTVFKSKEELSAALKGSNVPEQLNSVDFTMSRVVLRASNPRLAWAIDDGASLVVGLESLCQGIAPHCIATIIAGTTRDTLTEKFCPAGECGPVP